MKKMNLIVMAGILAFSTMVKAGVPDYVISGEEVKYYEKLRYGITSCLVGIEETARVRYSAKEIGTYRKDRRIYERMPVVRNNIETGTYAFMELIAYRNGLKLYRHKTLQGTGLPEFEEYFVYQDGNFVVAYDKKNYKSLNNFFFRIDNSIAAR